MARPHLAGADRGGHALLLLDVRPGHARLATGGRGLGARSPGVVPRVGGRGEPLSSPSSPRTSSGGIPTRIASRSARRRSARPDGTSRWATSAARRASRTRPSASPTTADRTRSRSRPTGSAPTPWDEDSDTGGSIVTLATEQTRTVPVVDDEAREARYDEEEEEYENFVLEWPSWSRDGKRVYGTTSDGRICTIDVASGELAWDVEGDEDSSSPSAVWSGDESVLAFHRAEELVIADAATGQDIATLPKFGDAPSRTSTCRGARTSPSSATPGTTSTIRASGSWTGADVTSTTSTWPSGSRITSWCSRPGPGRRTATARPASPPTGGSRSGRSATNAPSGCARSTPRRRRPACTGAPTTCWSCWAEPCCAFRTRRPVRSPATSHCCGSPPRPALCSWTARTSAGTCGTSPTPHSRSTPRRGRSPSPRAS